MERIHAVPGTVLSVVHVLNHFIVKITLWIVTVSM